MSHNSFPTKALFIELKRFRGAHTREILMTKCNSFFEFDRAMLQNLWLNIN